MSRSVLYLLCAVIILTFAIPYPVQATQIAQAGGAAAGTELEVEILFWDSIKASTDPADYQAYLETYPEGRFAALARARLQRYAKQAGATPPPATASKPTTEPAAVTATGKPVYVPAERRGAAAPREASEQRPRTYVARTRAWVYRRPTTKSKRTGEFFVEDESFKVTEVIDRGRWLKVITRSGKEGYVFAGQAKRAGSRERGSLFMNPDQEPTDKD